MSSLNKVMLIGRLGADPETRNFQNGGGVVNLRLATSEKWKDKSTGEQKERTEWHTVAIFADGLRGVASAHLVKGSQVYVEGQLQTRKWQDQSGTDRYSTEVVLQGFNAKLVLLGTPGQQQGGGTSRGEPKRGYDNQQAGGSSNYDDLDDDIPF